MFAMFNLLSSNAIRNNLDRDLTKSDQVSKPHCDFKKYSINTFSAQMAALVSLDNNNYGGTSKYSELKGLK